MYISLLGIISTLVAVYLVYDHIKDDEASFCDMGSHISCSRVRRSIFSELFNVPVALFGVLFNLMITFGALLAIQSDYANAVFYVSALFYCCVFGTVFVFYLVFAEVYLATLCPFCTVLHICQFLMMWLSWKVFDSTKGLPSMQDTLWGFKTFLIWFAIFNLVPIVYFNGWEVGMLYDTIGNEPPVTNEAYAQCITADGWRFYGLSGCAWCGKQKLLFGDTVSRIAFVDCENVRETCKSLGIDAFPTWIKFDEQGNEIDRWKGYISLESWAIKSKCQQPYLKPAEKKTE